MKYLVIYSNDKKEIFKTIIDTSALAIAEVRANLLAYKHKGSVIKVKQFELDNILLTAIKQRSASIIVATLQEACNGPFSMEHLEQLSKDYFIKYEVPKISKNSFHDSEMWYIIDNYIIAFYGSYNAYGILELKNITVYDQTDSIIIDEDINSNMLSKGA